MLNDRSLTLPEFVEVTADNFVPLNACSMPQVRLAVRVLQDQAAALSREASDLSEYADAREAGHALRFIE